MRILACVLAALTVLVGVHVVFAMVLAVTLVALFAVGGKVLETGMRCRPRPVLRTVG